MAGDRTGSFSLHGWLWNIIIASGVIVAASMASDGLGALMFKQNFNGLEAIGVEPERSSLAEARWFGVAQVRRGGAAEASGLQSGDSVRFDDALGELHSWQPGDRVSLKVARGDERFDTVLVAQSPSARSGTEVNALIAYSVHWLLVLFFTLFLLIRGRGNRAAKMLAIMLPFMGGLPALGFVPGWAYAPIALALKIPGIAALSFLWPHFAMEISGGPTNGSQFRLVSTVAVISMIVSPVLQVMTFLGPLPVEAAGLLWIAFIICHQIAGYSIIAYNYRHNDAAARNRIKIVAGAFFLFLISVSSAVMSRGTNWVTVVLAVSAFALLGYGLLRQRLFDLNFAVNRTLVYGAAAFTLLVTFGLVEYIAKSMIPVAWPTAGPFISAGIAVLLFLSFHRLHHWFEHHIERLFFHKWHAAEAALRRFVHAAGHFDSTPALCEATVNALTSYTGGAQAALYVRENDRSFSLSSGRLDGAAPEYSGDDPAFALMRSERTAIELTEAPGSLPGELALPMLEQGVLAGFVLLAPKHDGSHYRPDEKQLLDWAVHQIGLDLRALHARQLESQVVGLEREVNAIAQERDRLLGRLSPQS